jgi:hypothetical protein
MMTKSTTKPLLRVVSAGSTALNVLQTSPEAFVMGTTSRGIYIKTSEKWVVFISLEPFRGPLTLTLNNANLPLSQLTTGTPVYIDSRSSSISIDSFVISTNGCAEWVPPRTPTHYLPGSERRKRVAIFAEEALKRKKWAGFSPTIPFILNLPDAPAPTSLRLPPKREEVLHVRRCIKERDVPNLSSLLIRFLGVGQGLTPSGDDFLIGLMSALNRWMAPLWPAKNLSSLNHQIVEAAYQRTTFLSANLIECATLGQADERLINALDWIMCGVIREPEFVSQLLGWGSSSGMDAFVGMATALSA